MDNMVYCNNCGRLGHQYHQCKLPITSYGIITFRINEGNKIEYLLIRRKDTLGYVDFIRGKYPQNNIEHISNMLKEMTIDEKKNLCKEDFKKLWNNLWGTNSKMGGYQRIEERTSSEKLNNLKSGINILNRKTKECNVICLDELIKKVNTSWIEPEWGFPKGRRNHLELDIECALREWEEETGYLRDDIDMIQNLAPFEETFTGSNYKSYKHKYYVGHYVGNNTCELCYDKTEVGKLEWKTYNDAMLAIRPYNIEKKRLLEKIHQIITTYII
tara:strand:+ start:1537 stop:2352 length:816 start_codon:yes stop_codon:yes gene_type:complete